ncbi:MAG: hypothetical protein JNK29_16965, partial [Anaerolineales bacterium]|nr:hypothetical protein [Anaerolineales bacterium]
PPAVARPAAADPTPEPAAGASGPARLYFPFLATAGPEIMPGLADLLPPDVNVVLATADAAGEHAPVSSRGAAVFFQEQPVAVIAPPGAYSQTVTLTLQAQPAADTDAAAAFTLEARTPQGALVAQAERPLRLVVDLRGADLPAGQQWVLAYQDAADPALWHRPEVSVHDAAGLISVETSHFSNWLAGAEPQPWKFTPNLPAAAAFSGAATYRYPIAVPAGRAGLTPNIDVSYSSRALDGLTASADHDQGALGLGWSLGEAEISRRAVYTVVGENGLMPVYPDLFSLALNGQTHALFPANGADTAHDPVVRYYAENGPQLYIERRLDPAAPNQDKLYWLVRTPDGTAYRFGYTAEAEVVQTSLIAAEVGHPGLTDAHPLRWLVDTATDVFGNQLQYDYDTWPKPDGGLTTDGVRPAEIRYNYAALAPDPLTRVGGPYASRLAFLGTDSGRVREIQVFHVDLIRPVRRILFSLDSAAYFGAANCGQASVTNLVTAIQDVGSDGAARLPAVTFEYVGLPHYNNCFPYLYLRQVHNGYGGRVRFTYASDGRQEDLHGEPRVPAFGRAYFVTHVETWDGVTPQPAVTQIEYSRPCYDNGVQLGRLPGAFDCLLHPAGSAPGVAPNLAVGGLVGFETATLTVLNYGGLRSLQRTVTTFSQDPLTLGQAVRVQTLGWDGAAWALRQESETDYTAALIAGGPARAFRVRAARTTTHNGGEPVTVRSENTRFDDFGNVEEQVEYDLAGQPYRRTVSQYAHNTAAGQWITGALVRQRVFAWEGAGWAAEPLSESRSDYNADGDPATAAPDAHGRLTASRQWAGGGDFVDTRYTYDAWGHQATVTTFGGYGSAARYAEADPRITRAEYDAALFALYPVAQTNARGHQVTAVYDTRLGLPVQVTDPNGAATRFAYDPFGRLTTVARPGDTLEIPTTRYVYVDGGAPSRIETYQRTASGCAACERGTLEFYDGLGRTVQTRGAAAGGRQTVVNTTYDALGRAVSTYLPVFEPAGLAFTRPAGWEARPHTLAEYDALGRSVRVIGADGATALAAYRGPRTAVVDAAGRQRLSEADAFGRTVAVFEYQAAGLAAPDFDLPAYAVTRYTYDPRGALTRMEALSATTIITYSVLGQKIGLADPDLGVWTYAYQPSGELVAQTDARGVTTRFTYDALGRLTGRAFSIPAGLDVLNPGPAFHYYDEGGAQAQALGRRTRLVDAAGTTRWQYDARGRVTAEERRLAGGLGVYAFAYAYNAADQLLTLTYPDGEIVTTTLDAAGRPLGLTDGAGTPLVTGADYDAQARLTRLGLGNGLTTTYTYYAATEPLQGGRLRRLSVGDALLDLTYAYDPAGNLARLTDASRLLAGSQVLQFEYDGLERLTRAWTSGSAQGGYAEAYRYDALGRLLEREQAGQTQTYTYADPAHLHAATALGTDDRFTYDANGAMTERVEAGTAYTQTWTADDRLAVMQWVAAGRPYTTTFAYDGDGRRAVRIEADERGAVATVYAAGLYERQLDVTGQDLPRLWYAPAAGGRRSPGLARPAADDYTGPVVRNVQLWVAPVYGWENGHRVPTSSWSCDNKPAYPALGTECGDPPALLTIEECYGEAAPCYAGEMYTQLDGGYTTTVTYGPATVQAALTCTLGHNGWCLDQAVLTLLGTEPLPNETITGIAYSLNGAGIGSHTLNINPRTLTVGDTAATYYFWAESSFGDQSAMQSLPVKVDTTRPALQFSGPLPGAWDLSAAIVITATDLGSGPACLRIAWDAWPLDDGSCAAVSASTVFPGGGVHTLNVRAWDRAGQPTTWSGTYAPDLTPPVLAGPAVTACAADSVWQRTCNAPAFTWPAAADAFSGVAGYEVYWGTSAAGAAG